MENTREFIEKQIWKSALILTIAGIITKVLSAAYRIPFQNIAGDIGFYIYQQVYPFYGIALILATYGFPVIISKLIAEQMQEKKGEPFKVLLVAFVFLSIFFIGLFLILYTGAEKISYWMGDKELSVPLKVVSFSLLFVPILSVLRGYFQGQNNMTPTAISQIGEQLVRVTTILVLTYFLLTNGYSSYIGGAGAVFGSIIGGFCAVIILFYFWIKTGDGHKFKFSFRVNGTGMNSLSIVKAITVQGFTICISSLFLILLQLVDAMTLYSELVSSGGFSLTEAKVAKGVFDRGQPLIQLGTVVATSLSLTLVPLISSAKVRNDFAYIKEQVQLSIRVSVIVGLGAALGLMAIIKATNYMLFTNTDGSYTLAILAITILFSSIVMTSAAILQGLGKTLAPAYFVLIGVVCKIILNYLFIPYFGTVGAALATVAAYLLTTVFHVRALTKMLHVQLFSGYTKKALLAGGCMVISLYSYQLLLHELFHLSETGNRLFATFQSLSAVMIGGFIYILIVVKTNVFSEGELNSLPFGSKLQLLIGKKDKEHYSLKEE
ncbi:MAG TPA: polysaccharide biosynthesis protein [Bacillales bacterium]|nr:polysaccharide biosynthesis protein [Bacillales bacterium]